MSLRKVWHGFCVLYIVIKTTDKMWVRDKKGQRVYVTYISDVEPNKGGYYCETYTNDDFGQKIDDFCIHLDDLPSGFEQMHYNEQEKAIKNYIKDYYKDTELNLNYRFDK